MKVFRLVREPFSETLSGYGASLKGGRWNSTGFEMIYTASNLSLAMAEVAVHFTWATLPPDYLMMTISIPSSIKVKVVKESTLPTNWKKFPHMDATKRIGNSFIIQNKFCLLKVPSAVTKGDNNILINPFHLDFKKIEILSTEPFPFDNRLIR